MNWLTVKRIVYFREQCLEEVFDASLLEVEVDGLADGDKEGLLGSLPERLREGLFVDTLLGIIER